MARTYPLSAFETGMWLHHELEPRSAAFHCSLSARVRSEIDVAALQRAWRAFFVRHEMLRTTFGAVGAEVAHTVHDTWDAAIEVVDASRMTEEQLHERVLEDYRCPFDLSSGSMRAHLYRRAPNDAVLVVTHHHIAIDLTSFDLVQEELFELYASEVTGAPFTRPLPAATYADFVQWQRDFVKSDAARTMGDAWRGALDGTTAVLALPTDHPRPAARKSQGTSAGLVVPPETTQALRGLGKSLFRTLFAAYAVLLHRYTGQDDLIVGTPADGRSASPSFERVFGNFVNMLPIRARIDAKTSFDNVRRQVDAAITDAVSRRDYPFQEILQRVRAPFDPSRPPLCQTTFSLTRTPRVPAMSPHMIANAPWHAERCGLVLEPYPLYQQQGQLDVNTLVTEAAGGIYGELRGASDLFDPATLARMGGHFATLLGSIVRAPDRPVGELDMLPDEERRSVLFDWNATRRPFDDSKCMHELFEARATAKPEAIAIVASDGATLTYGEVERRANQLANHLRSLGIGPGLLVAVLLERSPAMLVTTLGILKAGGAYVPIDAGWPAERVAKVVSSKACACKVLVTQSSRFELAAEAVAATSSVEHLVVLDADQAPPAPPGKKVWAPEQVARASAARPPRTSSPDDVAYIIYTSGSTGTPKGVIVKHRPAVNLIDWVNRTYEVSAADRVLFVTSLCFDLSVYDIFGVLAAGGSVRVATSAELRDPERLLSILSTEPITFWDSAPAALQQVAQILPSEPVAGHRLRLVFLSGDWIPVTLPDALRRTFPGCHVVSLGGATEATVWSNYYPIGAVDPRWVSIPYGRPIQNARYYVLDAWKNPCPIGVPGDLYIGGDCLSSGYIDDPELTASKFVHDPYNPDDAAGRMYRTGDLSRFWADGNLEFLGRVDHQVKIRGFRIELGEIEAVLSKAPAVREALVLAREDTPGDKKLVAYVVLHEGRTVSASDLRSATREMLPEYMVPSAVVVLERWPVTANGKLDRRALPAPGRSTTAELVAPRDELEAKLAELWRGVLALPEVGVRDNFFEVGGNSLVAVRLVQALEKQFGARLPMSALFEHATIEKLARYVRAAKTGADAVAATLITLREGSAREAPLFCVHPVGGHVFSFRELARTLAGDYPVVGVRAQGTEGEAPPRRTIEEMATAYLAAAREREPEGPLRIVGWSMGGLIAYEMARQLVANGEPAPFVAAIDTRWGLYTTMARSLDDDAIEALFAADLAAGGAPIRVNRVEMATPLAVFRAHLEAIRRYEARPYAGRFLLCLAREAERSPPPGTESSRERWRSIVGGGLEIVELDGDHFSVLRERGVTELAKILDAHLVGDAR